MAVGVVQPTVLRRPPWLSSAAPPAARRQGPEHSSAHTAVQQDPAKDQEAAAPAIVSPQEIGQQWQNAEAQGRARGRQGIGERSPPYKVVPRHRYGWLKWETESQTCKEKAHRHQDL